MELALVVVAVVGVLIGVGSSLVAARRFPPQSSAPWRLPRGRWLVVAALALGGIVAMATLVLGPDMLEWNVAPAPFWSPSRTAFLLIGALVFGATLLAGQALLRRPEGVRRCAALIPRGPWLSGTDRRLGVVLLLSCGLLIGSLVVLSAIADVPPFTTGTVFAVEFEGSMVQSAPFPGLPYLLTIGAIASFVVAGGAGALSLARRPLQVTLARVYLVQALLAVTGTSGLVLSIAGERMWLASSNLIVLTDSAPPEAIATLVVGVLLYVTGWALMGGLIGSTLAVFRARSATRKTASTVPVSPQ